MGQEEMKYETHDEVSVTGNIWYDGDPFPVKNLKCIVAMLYEEFDNKRLMKIWPKNDNDIQLPSGHGSVFWVDVLSAWISKKVGHEMVVTYNERDYIEGRGVFSDDFEEQARDVGLSVGSLWGRAMADAFLRALDG